LFLLAFAVVFLVLVSTREGSISSQASLQSAEELSLFIEKSKISKLPELQKAKRIDPQKVVKYRDEGNIFLPMT